VDHLERDELAEREVLGDEHAAHPTFGELLVDPVAPVDDAPDPAVRRVEIRVDLGLAERAEGVRSAAAHAPPSR
jgi:hypothetical protein